MNPQKTEEREGERKFEHDILELDVAIRREKRAERREMERIQFNYGIDLFWSSKSFFFLALSATCRGDVRQKRASVAYNERGTPFLFLFFPSVSLSRPPFFVSAPSVFEVARWKEREPKKCERSIDTRPSVKSLVNFSLSTDPRYFSFTKFKFLGTKIFEVEFELDGLIYEYRILEF